MTKAKVDPGICGLKSEVVVSKKDKQSFSIQIQSDCDMVEKLGEKIVELGLMDVFKRIIDNPVYTEGSRCLRHTSCPVPSAVLKALEIEAGLALPKDVKIEFETEE
ncbi:MAG: hypothetical protein GXO99_06575 [Nitrospirae bacterium]|nr:hypothetical protein [Nitrospirota bacterium]